VSGLRSLAIPATAALLAAAPFAFAFTVELGEIVGVRNIEVTATALDRAVLIKLVNRENADAQCELHIDSGPEERTRNVLLKPLGSKVLSQSIRPNTQRVRVSGTCT
jgi:hypothetical protein